MFEGDQVALPALACPHHRELRRLLFLRWGVKRPTTEHSVV